MTFTERAEKIAKIIANYARAWNSRKGYLEEIAQRIQDMQP